MIGNTIIILTFTLMALIQSAQTQTIQVENHSLVKNFHKPIDKPQDIVYDIREVYITHYTHTGNPTASGAMPTVGRTVACNFLPFGTEVEINGHIYVVEDTGSIEYLGYNTIDIFVDSYEEAIQLGRYKTEMRVLK